VIVRDVLGRGNSNHLPCTRSPVDFSYDVELGRSKTYFCYRGFLQKLRYFGEGPAFVSPLPGNISDVKGGIQEDATLSDCCADVAQESDSVGCRWEEHVEKWWVFHDVICRT
jgi:hypothetical protein